MSLQPTGSAVTDQPVIKTDSESIGGIQRLSPDIEIVTAKDSAGIWIASGV
jgi:hypothetical protein